MKTQKIQGSFGDYLGNSGEGRIIFDNIWHVILSVILCHPPIWFENMDDNFDYVGGPIGTTHDVLQKCGVYDTPDNRRWYIGILTLGRCSEIRGTSDGNNLY